MSSYSLNVPINPVSFGMVSIAILREIFARGDCPPIFCIGDANFSTQNNIKQDFTDWVNTNRNIVLRAHKRKNPIVKLWHIEGSLESYSNEQHLITFHETDTLTPEEVNILNQQKVNYVTSSFSEAVFKEHGVESVKYLDLGFDSNNFWKTNKRTYDDGRIVWGLAGKLEPVRKQHSKAIKSWVKKYGNNKNHFLHAFVYNSFLKPEDNNAIIGQILEGRRVDNIKFYPSFATNAEYNEVLNTVDIMLGVSGGEGRDLPVFHATALGKHVLGLNAHAYKDYLTPDNAVLIEPTGKIKAEDGIFFRSGRPFNQGNFFDWDQDDFCDACDVAVERFKKNPENIAGLELQKRTYKKTVETILGNL